MSCLSGPVVSWNSGGLCLFLLTKIATYETFPAGSWVREDGDFSQRTGNPKINSCNRGVLLIWLGSPQSFGFAVGDVYWPGGQGHPEVATSSLPSRGEAGEEGD